jgi:chromosome segregation ATPase
MKWLLLLFAAGLQRCDADASLVSFDATKPNVIQRVVALMEELKEKIRNDGELEQASYDKYACWCEDTLGKKAADIAAAKEEIDALQKEIEKLTAEIATHDAEIKDLKKLVAANIEEQREATEVREKEKADYEEEKNENEQCMGAVEAAIKVLSGAGTGKKAALVATMREAQILSVVAGVKGMLKNAAVIKSVSASDMKIVEKFVERPEDFMGSHSAGIEEPTKPMEVKQGVFYPNELGGFLSAIQLDNTNPYGDYAPQSTRVSGVLKSMYDTFAMDLEKLHVEEANRQKSFEELMKTKQAELESLQASLDQQTLYSAEKTKQLADTKVDRQNTKEQLEADEAFFAQAKESCKIKAGHWAQRTMMRTEEMKGIDNAVQLLSGENAGIFENATSTFLQISSDRQEEGSIAHITRTQAYHKLQSLASQYQNMKIAKMAMALSSGGHFDDVIVSIDRMIEVLRKEEQDDITERDWCENRQNKNKNDDEDLKFDLEKLDEELKRAGDEKKELIKEIAELEEQMNETQDAMDELLAQRNEAEAKFRQAVKDDTDAILLLDKAIEALSEYYKRNKMPIGLAQASKKAAVSMLQEHSDVGVVRAHSFVNAAPAPEYSDDEETPPETIFEDGNYAGHSSEAGGLVAILKMIQEDFQKEIDTARKEDAESQAAYEADRADLQKVLDKLTQSRNAKDKELAELNMKIAMMEGAQGQKKNQKKLEGEKKLTLEDQCGWVKTHFETRRDKRKAEMDGLVEAKNYLAGMDSEQA